MTTREQLRAITRDVAPELARETGDDWRYVPDDDTYAAGRIRRADGAQLWIHGEGWTHQAGRIEIHGDYPRGPGNEVIYLDHQDRQRGMSTRITVAESRGPKVIAREIARRLLPDYLERLERVRERVARDDEHEARRRRFRGELAGILGATGQLLREERGGELYVNTDAAYVMARVDSDGHVTFDRFTVSDAELARAICRVIAESSR